MAPPQGEQAGELLRLDLLVADVVQDGAAIEFHDPHGKDGLRYSSLQAVDAAGRWVTVPWNGWNEADFYQEFPIDIS